MFVQSEIPFYSFAPIRLSAEVGLCEKKKRKNPPRRTRNSAGLAAKTPGRKASPPRRKVILIGPPFLCACPPRRALREEKRIRHGGRGRRAKPTKLKECPYLVLSTWYMVHFSTSYFACPPRWVLRTWYFVPCTPSNYFNP